MMFLAVIATFFASSEPTAFCDLPTDYLSDIRVQKLSGELEDARSAARETLDCVLRPEERVELLIELATIEDRVGLHQNTRPVAAALEAIENAARISESLGARSKAAVTLAKADYLYREEMSERKFEKAEAHAKAAIALFESLGDKHGQADAVHLLGLIHFQRRQQNPEQELKRARELFDQSRDLDNEGGARVHFCGEYGRHVGYIYYVQNEYEVALPHFEESLECRKQAGAIDASLFAAQTLGSTLVRAGRADKAAAALLYGLTVAGRMESPVGIARLGYALGDMYVALDDVVAAREAYTGALNAAVKVDYVSHVEASQAALESLDEASDSSQVD